MLWLDWVFLKTKLSERVCRPCGHKIRNAAELYSFIEKAVSTEEDKDVKQKTALHDYHARKKRSIEIGEESENQMPDLA